MRGQLHQKEIDSAIFAEELALDDSLRPIKGAINIAETAKVGGYGRIYLPTYNAAQASLIDGIEIIAVSTIKQLFLHFKRKVVLGAYEQTLSIKATAPLSPPCSR